MTPRTLLAVLLALAALAAPAGAAGGECCSFAGEIDQALDRLAEDTATAIDAADPPVAPARAGALLKAVAKARELLADILDPDETACEGRAEAQKAVGAARWLGHYRETLADVAWDTSLLDGDAAFAMARLESLGAGVCEDGPALPLE